MPTPRIAVIIRAFNEEAHIGRLLDALHDQTCASFETIVVDSGSVDLTPKIAEQCADRLIRIDPRDFTFGYSLNVGIRSTDAPFLAIISAHALPTSRHWLERLVAPLADPAVAMVYGRQLGVPQSKFSEARDFDRTFGADRRRIRGGNFFANNANSAIRRDLWTRHPFDEHLSGLEDLEWARFFIEQGFEIWYEPEAPVFHIHNETWRQVRHRYYREAVAARNLGLKTRSGLARDTVRELYFTAADLATAARAGTLRQNAGEIARFRFHKNIGHARGLLKPSDFDDADVRERELFDRYQKAVVVRGPRQVKVEEVPIPALRPGDVLVKVAYAGLCGTDLEIFNGSLSYFESGLSTYPLIPGHEFSGRIAAVGANPGHWRVNDPVVVECIQSCGRCSACVQGNPIGCPDRSETGVMRRNGAFAEYMATPSRFVHRLPRDMDLRVAALCEPTAVALKGLRRLTRVWEPGITYRCGVVGGGPIGYLITQLLVLRGHRVTVFDRNPLRRALYDHAESDLALVSEMNAIVEATGDPAALDDVLHHSAPNTAILLIGLPYARKSFDFGSIVAYDKTIVGSVGSNGDDFAAAIEIIGRIRTDVLVQHLVPFSRFDEAMARARERQVPKILVEIDPLLNEIASIESTRSTTRRLSERFLAINRV